eukprot:754278-Hanusia_phi.AAC.3
MSMFGSKDLLEQNLRIPEDNVATSPESLSPRSEARAEQDCSLPFHGSTSEAYDRLTAWLSSSVSVPKEPSGSMLHDPLSNWNLDSEDVTMEPMGWSAVSSTEGASKGEANLLDTSRWSCWT